MNDTESTAALAATLAEIDGAEDARLHQLRWTYGSSPEPIGDVWELEYLPKGERLARTVIKQFDKLQGEMSRGTR